MVPATLQTSIPTAARTQPVKPSPDEYNRQVGGGQIGGGTSSPRPRTHTSEPMARRPYFEKQQDQHCWVHSINMVMGRKHMDVGKTLSDIKRIVQADDELRARHRDKPLYHETKGFYATDLFRDYAEGTHGIYINKIGPVDKGPVDKDTGEITAGMHRGQNITQVIRQQSGAGVVLIDHKHAVAVIAHGDKWYYMDAEGGGPRMIHTNSRRWKLLGDDRKATAYLVSEDTVYRDAYYNEIENGNRNAPRIEVSDDDEVMEDDAPLAPPKTLSDDDEVMEDAAPLAPPKRKRGSRNRTDRTNNLTLAPRSTERMAPQPASTSTHIERTDAPTRMTDGEGCNDEPAAQRPKKSPIARPDAVTWDEVINTILKGNAKAKRLMGWRYTYVVQHVGEMLRGLERRDKRKANKLMRLCRTKWGGGITGHGQQVGE